MNDLHKRQVAAVRRQVENLRLNARRVHVHPFEIVARELRVRHRRGLLGDGADGGGAVDGLLGAGHVGQPVWGKGGGQIFVQSSVAVCGVGGEGLTLLSPSSSS